METYPKVESVAVLAGMRLRITFVNGEVRVYDCSPLLAEEPFAPLANTAFFRQARADAHGYGVVWSDSIDLSESELWLNSVPAEQEAA